jgi:hypothetical protein
VRDEVCDRSLALFERAECRREGRPELVRFAEKSRANLRQHLGVDSGVRGDGL